MMLEISGARIFRMADQQDFADLSGDRNPLHVDPLAAERLLFGAVVVHGIHALLWGLEVLLSGLPAARRLRALRVDFIHPIYLDEEITIRWSKATNDAYESVIATPRWSSAIKISCSFDERLAVDPPVSADLADKPVCQELTAADYENAQGETELSLPPAFRRHFPHLGRSLLAYQSAILLASTRVVGMLCPGLHSVYSSLELAFDGECSAETGRLSYKTRKWRPRFRALELDISAWDARGTIACFVRPGPFMQPSFEKVRNIVEAGTFRKQRALIVGGSRGLGELAVKLISAGGGEVTMTYHSRRADALRIQDELARAGVHIACREFDILANEASPSADTRSFTHLYYFAAPRILPRDPSLPGTDFFRRYKAYFLTGFLRLLARIPAAEGQTLGVFYPSSEFCATAPPGFDDYARAKRIGERLCACIGRRRPDMTLYAPRLPPLATDQTQSLLPMSLTPAPELLLKEFLALQAKIRARGGPI
jgi:hypothetical protein